MEVLLGIKLFYVIQALEFGQQGEKLEDLQGRKGYKHSSFNF